MSATVMAVMLAGDEEEGRTWRLARQGLTRSVERALGVCFVKCRATTRLLASVTGLLLRVFVILETNSKVVRGIKDRQSRRVSNSEQGNVLLQRLRRVIIITLAQHGCLGVRKGSFRSPRQTCYLLCGLETYASQ